MPAWYTRQEDSQASAYDGASSDDRDALPPPVYNSQPASVYSSSIDPDQFDDQVDADLNHAYQDLVEHPVGAAEQADSDDLEAIVSAESKEPASQQDNGDETEAEEEESVEAYMQRLLERMKGGESNSSQSFQPTRTTSKPVTPPPVAPKTNSIPPIKTNVENPNTEESHALTSEDYVPRTAVPEQPIDLEAMRKLANDTARTAIAKSVSKKPSAKGLPTKDLFIAAVGFVTGTGILLINGLTLNVFFLGMVCGYMIFLLWGYEATQSSGLSTKR